LSEFETTRWSLVYAARSVDPLAAAQALAALCTAYRPAVFAYVYRYCGHRADAEDLTQSFFEHLLAKRLDLIADANRGRFRQFLRTAIANFVRNHFDAQQAQRRRAVEPYPAAADAQTPEEAFELAWALTVLERGMAALAAEAEAAGKSALFAEIKPYLLEPAENLDYAKIGERLKLRANTVAVSVHRLKARIRELVRKEVAETISDIAELSLEMRALRRVRAS
jgi:RNA polymerase sigma factor (sigma-70 family)